MDSDEDLQPAKKPKDGGDSDSSIEIEGIYIQDIRSLFNRL